MQSQHDDLARTPPVSDKELLERRFQLARRAVALSYGTGAAERREREAIRLDLDACEAECRRRGLIQG